MPNKIVCIYFDIILCRKSNKLISQIKIVCIPSRLNYFSLHNIFRRNSIELLIDQPVGSCIFFFNLLRINSSANKKIVFECFF